MASLKQRWKQKHNKSFGWTCSVISCLTRGINGGDSAPTAGALLCTINSRIQNRLHNTDINHRDSLWSAYLSITTCFSSCQTTTVKHFYIYCKVTAKLFAKVSFSLSGSTLGWKQHQEFISVSPNKTTVFLVDWLKLGSDVIFLLVLCNSFVSGAADHSVIPHKLRPTFQTEFYTRMSASSTRFKWFFHLQFTLSACLEF